MGKIGGQYRTIQVTEIDANTYLTQEQVGIIRVRDTQTYVYLPAYLNNSGLSYLVKALAVGVIVGSVDGGDSIDGAKSWVNTRAYDWIQITAYGGNSGGWMIEHMGGVNSPLLISTWHAGA